MQQQWPDEVTLLLRRWEAGEAGVVQELAPLVYDHLRVVAASYLNRERAETSLQATGLVHELFVRLLRMESVSLESREHFFAFAARTMRRIMVDVARARGRRKRTNTVQGLPLSADLAWIDPRGPEMVDLDHALDRLDAKFPRKARVVELRIFLGCTAEEAADVLGISKPTVDREMRFALAWLYDELRLQ